MDLRVVQPFNRGCLGHIWHFKGRPSGVAGVAQVLQTFHAFPRITCRHLKAFEHVQTGSKTLLNDALKGI